MDDLLQTIRTLKDGVGAVGSTGTEAGIAACLLLSETTQPAYDR